jgi:hypothetical protein
VTDDLAHRLRAVTAEVTAVLGRLDRPCDGLDELDQTSAAIFAHCRPSSSEGSSSPAIFRSPAARLCSEAIGQGRSPMLSGRYMQPCLQPPGR